MHIELAKWHKIDNSIINPNLSMKKLLFSLLITLSSTCFAQQTDEWKRIYTQDINDICTLLKEHHPGYVDTLNPEFRATIDQAFKQALIDKKQVTNYTSYRRYLQRFVNSFEDKHLLLFFKKDYQPLIVTAGIYPKYVNGKFVIDSVGTSQYSDLQIIGKSILEVDEVPVDSFFIEQHLEYTGNKNIVADWYYNAPRLLTCYKIDSVETPGFIKITDGNTSETIELTWSDVDETEVSALQRKYSSYIEKNDFSIRQIAEGSVWVNIPTFDMTNKQEQKFSSLMDSIAILKDLELLVVDLRGNDGGNSSYGNKLATAIYGKEFVTYTKSIINQDRYVEYRTSEKNAQIINEYGDFFKQIADSMNEARNKGIELYKYDFNYSTIAQECSYNDSQSLAKKVVVITDVLCFSACLDFMDIMRMHPSFIHVGLPTGADSQYIENRGEWLSSGFTGLSFSMKVYRNSIRKPNEAYFPTVPYPYEMSNTVRMEKWILENF